MDAFQAAQQRATGAAAALRQAVGREGALISRGASSIALRATVHGEMMSAVVTRFRNGFVYTHHTRVSWCFATRKQLGLIIRAPMAKARALRDDSDKEELLHNILEAVDSFTPHTLMALESTIASSDGAYAWFIHPHTMQPVEMELAAMPATLRDRLVVLYKCRNAYTAALSLQGEVTRWERLFIGFVTSLLRVRDQLEMVQRTLGAVFFTDYAPQFLLHLVGPRGSGKNQLADAILGSVGRQHSFYTSMGTFKQLDEGDYHHAARIPQSRVILVDEYGVKVSGAPTHTSDVFFSVCTSDEITTKVMREMPTDEETRALVLLLGVKMAAYAKLPDSQKRRHCTCKVSRSKLS